MPYSVYPYSGNRFKRLIDKGRRLLYTVIAQRKREKRCLFATAFSRFHLAEPTSALACSTVLCPRTGTHQILHINNEDVAVTRSIIQAGQLLDIEVLDHVVIGLQRFVSLKERGLAFSS
jgi:hypothetical protein